MRLIGSSNLIVKKSKFFGYLFELEGLEEIGTIINLVKKKHKKFTHICYATILKKEKLFKNDGEVGNPGKVLLSILERNNLENHCLVILRIFGGIKLGPSNVGKAFRNAGKSCLGQ